MQILKRFCKSGKAILSKPFSQGEHTYATDGFVAVRVPRIKEIPENPLTPNVNALPWDHEEIADWEELPEYSFEGTGICRECGGTGFQQTCPECDGKGEICVSTSYNEYHCECRTCGGNEVVPADSGERCEACYGTGKKLPRAVKCGRGNISIKLLEQIKRLPEVKISREGSEQGLYRFKFRGGVGLVAGYKV